MPDNRWKAFTAKELATMLAALEDSGSVRSDHEWYLRCSALSADIVKSLGEDARAALAKARGESDAEVA